MPPSVQKSNAKHYKGKTTITERIEFEGPHLMIAADGLGGRSPTRALEWAVAQRPGARRGLMQARLTHVGGPTVLIEVGGWRLLTDPTFDPPGRQYRFGWGTGSTKLAGPALDAETLLPIDAVLLTHDHHDDNLDARGARCCGRVPSVITTARAHGGSAAGRAG